MITLYLDTLINLKLSFSSILGLSMLVLIVINKPKYYYLLVTLIGFIYDVIFMDLLFINTTIFIVLGFIIMKMTSFFRDNMISNLLILILVITIYEVLMIVITTLYGFDYDFGKIVYIYLFNIIYFIIVNSVLIIKKKNKV